MTFSARERFDQSRDISLTCTHTAGLLSSRTSASCIAPRACSILSSLLKVAADINHKSLSSRRSRAARLFTLLLASMGGRAGGGGIWASASWRSDMEVTALRRLREWMEEAW